MYPWWLALLFATSMVLNPLVRGIAMDQVYNAVGHLIGSSTASDEKRAAEELMSLLRNQRLPLNLTIYEDGTGRIVPLDSLAKRSELSAGSDPPVNKRRWRPKNIQNIFILLRE